MWTRRWWLLAWTIVVAVAAGVIESTRADRFVAVADVVVRTPPLDSQAFTVQFLATPVDPAQQLATDFELLTRDQIGEATSQALPRFTADEVRESVTVTAAGLAAVFEIAATDSTPTGAKILAQTYAKQAIALRRADDVAQVQPGIDVLKTQLDRLSQSERRRDKGRTLLDRLTQVRVLAAEQRNNVRVLNPPTLPEERVSPRPWRAALLGALGASIVGALLVIVLGDRLAARRTQPRKSWLRRRGRASVDDG